MGGIKRDITRGDCSYNSALQLEQCSKKKNEYFLQGLLEKEDEQCNNFASRIEYE